MKTINLITLSKEERKGVKELAFNHFKQGYNAHQMETRLGIPHQTAGRWISDFKNFGKVIDEKQRGRRFGTHCSLTRLQKNRLSKIIVDKNPSQLKFNFALWSAKAVNELILKLFGVKQDISTTRRLLRSMGFTSQCPNRFAREQDQAQVSKWLHDTYPGIRKQAKAAKATIYWCDEAAVSISSLRPKGYAPKGKTPTIREPANRGVKVNMISAVSNIGKMKFMMFNDAMTASIFKKFIRRIVFDEGKMVYLIVDNLKVHHAKCLKPWIEQSSNKFRIFYLPSYSPELNPDEYLNNDVKKNISQKKTAKNKEELKSQVAGHLKARQHQKAIIQKLFDHEKVRYAKE